MLLTHYRSRHPRGPSNLHVAELVPIDLGSNAVNADIAIVNRHTGKIVALYEVLGPVQSMDEVRVGLKRLREYLDSTTRDYPVELGVVLPESRENEMPELRAIAGQDLQLVTYPA